MKKIFLLLLFFLGNLSWAIDFHYTVSPFVSLKNGTQNEYVYIEYNGKDLKESELNWEIDNSLFLGLNNRFEIGRLNICAEVSFGIPGNSGLLKDSDWLNCTKSPDYEETYYKTNYSESDNRTVKNIEGFVNLGWKIGDSQKNIIPCFEVEVKYSKNEATGGTAWYGASYYDYEKETSFRKEYTTATKRKFSESLSYPDDGIVIDLTRLSIWTWFGFESGIQISKRMNLIAEAKINPYVMMKSIDNHNLKKLSYLDEMNGSFNSMKFMIGTELSLIEKDKLFIGAKFFTAGIMKGISGTKNLSGTSDIYKKNSGISGFSYNYAQFDAGYRHRF